MDRLVAHVDMDSFFTAVEVLDDPSLAGRPVIVGADPQGGRGRGVVSAASYEARKYGVHSAMPISQAYRLCPQGIYLRGRMARYQQVSEQVMNVLAGFTPVWEQISVDEAFLDLTGCRRLWGSPLEMCRAIKAAILKRIGLRASVGLGTNKLVAKVASDLNKPDGLVIVEPGGERNFLAPLPLRKLWGIGPKTEASLKKNFGITTIGELAALSPLTLERKYGVMGRYLHQRAHGIDNDPVGNDEEAKSIGREITFDRDTADRQLIHRTLVHICDRVSARLRQAGAAGLTVTLKLRYQGFETHTYRSRLLQASDSFREILRTAEDLWSHHYQTGRKVRLVGVSVSNFVGQDAELSLFGTENIIQERERSLDGAVDRVRKKFGRRALIRGGELG